ncbi:MAG: protein-glutamate O-methyltransferase CheR [Bacteroidales bacterium]|nr:protein-glutamate O-methyltransferase CheR [Bacteroidales bacterium]MDD4603481.1 protein-glutamate O-methyltransferase CheR [Bacteroidales bacterium]
MKKIQEEQLENQDIEVRLVIEAIYQKYGYDFRNYSQAHVKRRILNRLNASGMTSLSEMIHEVLYNSKFVDLLLMDLSITVTEMFRDPSFYLALRVEIFPLLKSYPFIKIWHAGCASGEEVYSMAILLKEEDLYSRTQIYATDFNPLIIKQAKEGTYPVNRIKEFAVNYQKSGGKNAFSDYYTTDNESAKLLDSLKKNIVFATHNLVTDSVFAEVNLVICRNVLIYFDRQLQDRVIRLFDDSLPSGGILCLGSKENLQFSSYYGEFNPLIAKEKIYIKKYPL